MQETAPEAEPTEADSTTEVHERVQITGDRPLGLIHSGNRYAFGFGPDYYGIWDAAASGPASERFPANLQGRIGGWKRYVELEPSAASHDITVVDPGEVWRKEVEARRRRGRRNTLIVLLVVVLAAVGGGIALFSGGKSATATVDTSGLSEAAKAKKAHIDITGAIALSDDMTQTSFSSASAGSIVGAFVRGEWKGKSIDLAIQVHDPKKGTFPTAILPIRNVTFGLIQPDGSFKTLASVSGECQITLDAVGDKGFSGSLKCTGLNFPGVTAPSDVSAKFGASSST